MWGAIALFGFGLLVYYVVSAAAKAGIESAFGSRDYGDKTTSFSYERTIVSSEPAAPIKFSEKEQREFEEALRISRMARVRDVVRQAAEMHNSGELTDSQFNALVDQAIATGYLKER